MDQYIDPGLVGLGGDEDLGDEDFGAGPQPSDLPYYFPPWVQAGYRTFEEWQAALAQQRATQRALAERQLELAGGAPSALIQERIAAASREQQTREAELARGFQVQQAQLARDLSQAQFEAQRAERAEDRAAAQYWRAREYELARNRDAMTYLGMVLQARRGPQDWVRYWYLARGMVPPAGTEPVPFERLFPSWLQPLVPPAGAPATPAAPTVPGAPPPAAPPPAAAPVAAGPPAAAPPPAVSPAPLPPAAAVPPAVRPAAPPGAAALVPAAPQRYPEIEDIRAAAAETAAKRAEADRFIAQENARFVAQQQAEAAAAQSRLAAPTGTAPAPAAVAAATGTAPLTPAWQTALGVAPMSEAGRLATGTAPASMAQQIATGVAAGAGPNVGAPAGIPLNAPAWLLRPEDEYEEELRRRSFLEMY